MKKLNLLFLMLIGASVMFTSCSDDDPTPTPNPDPEDEMVLDGNITEDRTLESGNVYTLASRVSDRKSVV